jgi:glutamate racemase
MSSSIRSNELPIGVFDSGIGGLTVLRALRRELPEERFLYLGDTARLPYGTKSAESVLRYSLQASELLVVRGIKCLVIACNTAAAVALEALSARFAPLPVLGVIAPGAAAGCEASRSGHIAVLATEGTVRGGAYQRAIGKVRPAATVSAQACSLFVALAEEGWTEGPIVEATAHRYLDALLAADPRIDTLLLGCTHFPVLVPALRNVVGPAINIVDSADTTAAAMRRLLPQQMPAQRAQGLRRISLLATDSLERFARVGAGFLGEPISADDVELVDVSLASS